MLTTSSGLFSDDARRDRREEGIGAEGRAAEAIADVAAQLVRARRRDRVVDQPHRLAELGRVAAGRDLDFADRHFRHRHQAQAGAVLLRVGVAVHLVVDAQQRAVGAEARHAELRVLGAADAGLEQREVVGVARDERQVVDLALVQVAADVDLAEVDHGGVGLDRDDFGDAADFHRHVDDGGRARRDRNAASAAAS